MIDLPMDGFPSDGFVTTTILARLMPFGAPSTPSAKGRTCSFAEPSGDDRNLRLGDFRGDVAPIRMIDDPDGIRPSERGGLSTALEQ
jgi:hypothetical protein